MCLSGGEPTQWGHFDAGLDLLASAPRVDSIQVITNGHGPQALLRHAHQIARVFVTDYPAHRKRIRKLIDSWPGPGRVTRWGAGHRTPPSQPIPGTLPASCRCGKPALYGSRIYACPTAPDRLIRLGGDLADPVYSRGLHEDWPGWLAKAAVERITWPLCEICISNGKVWKRLG